MMPRRASIPRDLRLAPFRARDAVAAGQLTRTALRGTSWRRMLPGIHVRADVELDHRMWCRAAALFAGPGCAVSGPSAAYLWGVAQTPSGSVEVTVPPRVRRVDVPEIRLVRSTLERADVTEVGGIPVTTPARTAFDLSRRLSRVEAVVLVDAMLGRNVLQLVDLVDYAGARRRWRGVAQVPLVLSLVEPRTESPMESRLRLVIVDAGLPRPVAQHDVRDASGRFVGRLDLAYPEWKIGIEYDGDHHRDRAAFRADLARANALRLAGWTVLRFTASDVWRNPGRLVAQIRSLIPT